MSGDQGDHDKVTRQDDRRLSDTRERTMSEPKGRVIDDIGPHPCWPDGVPVLIGQRVLSPDGPGEIVVLYGPDRLVTGETAEVRLDDPQDRWVNPHHGIEDLTRLDEGSDT